MRNRRDDAHRHGEPAAPDRPHDSGAQPADQDVLGAYTFASMSMFESQHCGQSLLAARARRRMPPHFWQKNVSRDITKPERKDHDVEGDIKIRPMGWLSHANKNPTPRGVGFIVSVLVDRV